MGIFDIFKNKKLKKKEYNTNEEIETLREQYSSIDILGDAKQFLYTILINKYITKHLTAYLK